MVEQDLEVMRRLGLAVGDHLRWGDLLERIRTSVRGDDLPSICGSCRWLPLGYCREGIDRLRDPSDETKPSGPAVVGHRPECTRQEPSRM